MAGVPDINLHLAVHNYTVNDFGPNSCSNIWNLGWIQDALVCNSKMVGKENLTF